MRAHYQGNTYSVAFDQQDAAIFSAFTDVPEGVVVGEGAFVYDSWTGDLIARHGSAAARDEVEWLVFSQDAQAFGVEDLGRQGCQVNPYSYCLPELAQNPKKHDYVGRRIELVHTDDPHTELRPGDRGTVKFVDDAGTIFVDWDKGSRLGLVPGADHFQWVAAENPTQISRTRGVKTMKGPYSAAKGYEPWIQKSGVLGEGFLTTMSKKERHKALDNCVAAYGYRSCLGRIMALERAKRGPRGQGEGVGVKYASKLKESREYLKKTYGGKGSFKRDAQSKKEARARVRAAADNPSATQHAEHAAAYLEAGQKAIKSAQRHSERMEKSSAKKKKKEYDAACERAKGAWRYALLALHELEHGRMTREQGAHVQSASLNLQIAASALLDHLGCGWAPNPYHGDAVALARYRQQRARWEKEGRMGPPPLPQRGTH